MIPSTIDSISSRLICIKLICCCLHSNCDGFDPFEQLGLCCKDSFERSIHAWKLCLNFVSKLVHILLFICCVIMGMKYLSTLFNVTFVNDENNRKLDFYFRIIGIEFVAKHFFSFTFLYPFAMELKRI